MRIAILGTRGIPNPYGGHEQYAEFLALGFTKFGHEVIVYNSHNHPFQESNWNNISIIHIQDNEFKFGSRGRFLYNLRCVRDLKNRNCDVVLQLDYSTLSLWHFLIPKYSTTITFMDNLIDKEIFRSKFMRKYLSYAEKLAVKYSDHLISDSVKVRDYLKNVMGKSCTLIPYALDVFNTSDESALKDYELKPYQYDLLISKFVAYNELEIILDGVVAANLKRPFLVVGNYNNAYGYSLKEKYKTYSQIRFLGSLQNNYLLNNLRYFSNLHFHNNIKSSSNGLLLQAMAAKSLICAKKNVDNFNILGEAGFYFNDAKDVAVLLKSVLKTNAEYQEYLLINCAKIKDVYNWNGALAQYENIFNALKEKQLQRTRFKNIRSQVKCL